MGQTHSPDANIYFVPHSSKWPFVGSIAMFVTMVGVASWLNDISWGMWTFYAGVLMLCATLFMWFGDVIRESVGGNYNRQVDVSFRMGMVWFIFSDVMFFAAFFGALFYARTLALPRSAERWNQTKASGRLFSTPRPLASIRANSISAASNPAIAASRIHFAAATGSRFGLSGSARRVARVYCASTLPCAAARAR